MCVMTMLFLYFCQFLNKGDVVGESSVPWENLQDP
jgi:hypothetical protein